MSYGIGPHDYDCACARCEARRSRTRSIHGDAHLTALIDERAFLDDEEIPESPGEGQCQ